MAEPGKPAETGGIYVEATLVSADHIHKCLADLKKRIGATRSYHFQAYRRLKGYYWLLFSALNINVVGGIMLSVVKSIMGESFRLNGQAVAALSLFYAVAGLASNLTATVLDLKSNSDKMHNSGRKMALIVDEVNFELGLSSHSDSREILRRFQREYATVLDSVDNHSNSDVYNVKFDRVATFKENFADYTGARLLGRWLFAKMTGICVYTLVLGVSASPLYLLYKYIDLP